MNTGLLIKEKRLEKKMSQATLAEKIGVNVATVSRWETGNIANMKRNHVAKLSEVLNIPIADLMGWNESKEEKPEESKLYNEIAEKVFGMDVKKQKHLMRYIEMLMEEDDSKEA